uniref:LAGLIDADG endonuclease n=1 Tax=Fusarium cerealis TaxID=56641 RepID=A0A6G6B1S8_FUSCE|nr:LAGLIDADG endonuclease [Fusarium cerealis]QID41912.1 LAGLIDADG endonuclease [Fusarium cerealis]QID41964.1 LAGLIDADG endonuclease [Fusarium cerealis]QID42016.1 LAGLIDADG endonuclease [Fusarium cerealis]QID42174.1 LAGLIDADG endonuclease [Fusarium cerealis]QID42226.1 LAGLIDADG endonuclease [Fusarium cerealis]
MEAFDIAVWVWISLYTFIIYNKFNSNFIFFYFWNYCISLTGSGADWLKPKSIRYFSREAETSSNHFFKTYSPERTKSEGTINNPDNTDTEFFKWFSGFTDAEGSFRIVRLASRTNGFGFRFSIGLHIDDLNVLNYIKNKLSCGGISISSYTCHFNVAKKEDIFKLINLFDIYLLNSTKRFDYLDFKKAYYLYYNKDELTEELINQILDIKNNMNSNRVSKLETSSTGGCDLKEFSISKEWLLGFIEGDGSFNLSRNTMEPVFSIRLTESELPLLIAIKEYLKDNLDLDKYSLYKFVNSPIVSMGKGKAVNNSKPLATLTIKNTHFLNNVFVPFFDESKFISKKGLDFKDFQIICKAIYIGAHRTEKIKDLLIKLSMTMNNFRLSNSSEYAPLKINLSSVDISDILAAEGTIDHLNDGRELDIKTRKLIHRRSSSSVFEIWISSANGAGAEIILKPNLAETAKEIGIGFNTLKRQLNNEEGFAEYKGYTIKRIGIFKKKL